MNLQNSVDVQAADNSGNLAWRRAEICDSASCVEVAQIDDDTIAVRDSKNPENGMLKYTAQEWTAFVHGVKNGEFDL